MHVPALNYKSWCGIHWGKPPSYSENCGKTNMPPWWGRSSSKEAKKKTNKESFIDTLHRKFKIPSDDKSNNRSGGSKRQCSDMVSEKGSAPQVKPRSPSLSEQALRCQNFSEGPLAQPLPLPSLHPASIGFSDSGISVPPKPMLEKTSKLSLCSPLPRPACIHGRTNPFDVDGGDLLTTSVSSGSSIDIDDPINSKNRSHHAIGYENGTVTAASALPCSMPKNQISTVAQFDSREAQSPDLLLSNQSSISSPKRRPLSGHVPCLQVTHHGPFFSAPDSSMSSPSRSPRRAFGLEQVMYSAIYSGRPYPDATFVSSGHCSSPGSGFNSGHNSMGGDMGGQLFWQHSRGSPEYSPIPSPRMTSPGPSSRIHSGAVTPIHPRAGGAAAESQSSWHDDVKQQSHRLPLPPVAISCSTFSPSSSPVASPSVSRSSGTTDNPTSPSSRWKKGKLLGRGSFGHVYVGFDSGSGEMCAMKEVTLFSDDAKSKESAKQLNQEIALLSRLRHPNIVQYYGSETVGDKLYIYLEYVSGGSIYKLLQEYGQFGELAVRNYTQQILSGLAYLHAKNTVHRDIKGANILVDPSGRVKLADFGMAKHITGQSCPLSFKGSPYWMAPEVIKNSNGCNRAVDIWSLGCTVLEMATTKPPWSQYEGVAAMFKIGNSKELPPIPNHLSDDGKDFVRLCLQRNLQYRPTAAQLLEHPFVRNAVLLVLERPLPSVEPSDPPPGVTSDMKSLGIGHRRNISGIDSERLAVHSSRVSKSDGYSTRNISCPVSPIGSPLLRARSPQHRHGGTSPPLPSPRTPSGSSTPLAAGSGASPFHHHKQSVYFQEGVGNGPNSPNNIHHANGISYHDIFGGSCESEVQGKHPGRRLAHGDLYDRVSRELLRDRLMMNPSVDLGPRSPLTSHTNCT